jgi:16S rRNA (cytidine1402-2'-O)-methyltransferase
MLDILGNRRIAVTRELTKKFEEIVRGPLEGVVEHFAENARIKGEFTLVIAGAEAPETQDIDAESIRSELQKCIAECNLSKKDAVKYVAETFGLPKNLVYQHSLNL